MTAAVAALLLLPWQARAEDRWLARDKALHIGAGAGFAAGGYALSAIHYPNRKPRIIAGLGFGLGASAAKEWRDRYTGDTSSWKDFGAGAIGTVSGVLVAWLVDRAVHPKPKATTVASAIAAAR
jgi:uncharacterized protein YfiM (DUF2279 family)